MTRTDALREIMKNATRSLSLREIQLAVELRTDKFVTDGTCSRRLREWGAVCERGRDGIYRYSLRK